MRIKSIEYENFRNFKNHGIIKCSTDGKVTIIYGRNGYGKTTLHQLFQWVFYGHVKFNKTATDHLYNLAFEGEQEYGDIFDVMGRIDFEHNDQNYSLTRKYVYRKGVSDSEKIAEEISLQKQDADYNWNRVDNPLETIEKLLPSGLSEYFFFDGENMIANLRVKGKDSAEKLKKAFYSIFDLDILESALAHIGRTDLKTTALGKLYLSKGEVSSGSQIESMKNTIEATQYVINKSDKEIKAAKEEKKEKQELIESISEQIGSNKSKTEYELQRKELIKQRDLFLKNAQSDQEQFGDVIIDMFPRLLISKAVNDAREKLNFKVSNSHLPAGINKRLIAYLSDPRINECICGNPLCDKERNHISNYLNLLPPKSYTSIYNEFTNTTSQWGKSYDKEKIEGIIMRVIDNQDAAERCDKLIKDLDEAEKQSPNIEDLVVARQEAEERIGELDQIIVALESQSYKHGVLLKKRMKEFDKITSESKDNERIAYKIGILEDVASYFKKKLDEAVLTYSKSLEDNIQYLLDYMLTSKRKVSVSSEFAVRVTDSYNDESKSEGQFAVVSFAYIGGILKMLQDDDRFYSKDYPLVLDGPFSKLDRIHIQNVADMLPRFAPQVILFSKDDLQDVFTQDVLGRIWSIRSNEEQNIARVEEGVPDNYFDN